MSLFNSMVTAISGMTAQQQAIANISSNVANSQTVGYKEQDTDFESLLADYGSFKQPGDVKAVTSELNDVSGGLVASQEATSLAVNGQGFFVVKAPPDTSSGTANFPAGDSYTRAGDFTVNSSGYLVNSSGYYLEGYGVNSSTGAVSSNALAPIKIPTASVAPTPTSLMNLAANLPSTYPLVGSAGYSAPAPVTMTVYGADGAAHTVDVQFNHTAANAWTATISAAGSTAPQANPVTLQLKFGDGTTKAADGTIPAPGTLASITDISSPANTTAPVIPTMVSGGSASVGLDLNFGLGNQAVSLDLGKYATTAGVTQFSGTAVSTTLANADGSASGNVTGVSIDQSGYVTIAYSNGVTQKAYQVGIAQFADANKLQSLTGSAFAATDESGAALVSAPGTSGAGSISPSTLEESNVDISTELTKLITAQQAYSSNARVISTADQMLQTATQLVNLG